MRLGNLITGALMLKLLAKAVKNSRENGRDILNDNNGSRRQRKNSGEGAGESKMPGVPKAAPSPENAPKRAEKSSSLPLPFRPIPAKPDTGVPDHFTPCEGADMTCADADAAGFEFIGSDKYHGIDWYLCYQYKDILGIGSYGSKGIKACVITGWHGSDTIVKVPRTINGRPVVSIEREAFKGSPIDEIYLPDTVLIIKEMAFMKSALTYARLSENLYRIMDRAFCGCNLLERVYLGNVSHIGKQAFYDCKALSEIRLPDSVNRINDGAFQGSFLRKIYWKNIAYAGDNVVAATPFSAKNDCVILGGTLQKCTVSNVDVIMIDDPQVDRIGAEAFCRAKAKKVIFTENVRTVGTGAFNTYMQRLTAVIAPGAHNFGDYCFANVDRVTVSDTEHFTIEEHSFKGTNMETSYAIDGSGYYCVTVRNTLAFVGEDYAERIHHGILTLSGDTLVMDGSVHFTAAKRIPCLGMKKLLLSENLKQLYSFHSIEEFEEIIFRSSRLTVRETIPYRPKKSVTLRFKFNCGLWKVDSAVLLYLPNVVKGSAEAERLCALYDRCLKCAPFTYDPFFKFDLYDSEILNLVSSYRARFTIARLRLEGEYELSPEARERYENFLLTHKRKAEFAAKKHGDTALLSLLKKISPKKHRPEKELHNTAAESSPPTVPAEPVRPVPAKPDTDVPDYFTPYEGADMTCAEADAAGFEFVGSDRYHGVDFWLSAMPYKNRNLIEEVTYVGRGEYCRGGIPGCVITGWHGSGETVKIPRTINGRPVVQIEKEAFAKKQIKEIYIPDSVIGISERAFAESALTYARLSKALVYIGKEAFSECALLERVYMGNVRLIDERAFFECERLRQVRLPEEVWYIKDRAFAGSGLEKLYWNRIMYSDSYIIFYTPFDKRHELIVLGDTLQRCSTCAPNELIIDIPGVTAVGASAFKKAAAKKIILSENIRFIDDMAFAGSVSDRIAEEIYAPGAWKFGGRCFDVPIRIKKITVSENPPHYGEKGYLYMKESAFYRTPMEERYLGGSRENPCICAMVRNILARVDLLRRGSERGVPFEILTLSEDGGTLIMDDRVVYTEAGHIPNLGAKKLIVSRNMRRLHSFGSIEDFEEIVFGNPVIYTRDYLPFRPKKSVTVRYKFDLPAYGKPVDCPVLLYLPNVAANSPEAEKLYALYDRCLYGSFSFDRYDREILTLVSSYRARFTIARMRLENDYGLTSEAREWYENFLLAHKRKAEFTAKKHGDTALLSLFEKLSEKNTDPKGDPQK